MTGLNRLRAWLAQQPWDGILLSRRDNYAWIAGADKRNHVLTTTENGVAALLVTAHEVTLFADSIDGTRLLEEEVSFPLRLETYPWHGNAESCMASFLSGKHVASDTGKYGTINIQGELSDLRTTLSDEDQTRYRKIGQTCARVVESVCRDACRGMTENEVAVLLQTRCLQQGINPVCVLVGCDDRIVRYRHPMSTNKRITQSLMVVLGGEKDGLNISMTRFVYFEAPSPAHVEKYRKTQWIFAQMQAMTQEDVSYSDWFSKGQALYAQAGYPDEWQLHHQGGPTGYACREKIVTPRTEGRIALNQAFAWNPSITGTKCEETTLLTSRGIEILTRTSDWPVTTYETTAGDITVADILVKQS